MSKKWLLTEELFYFSSHLNNKIPKIANGQHALQVMKILIEASEQLEKNENKNKYFVHESSYVDNDVSIGDNTKVWHYSHIQTEAVIGENCSLGQNVNIANNVRVGNNVKIQNNVSIYEGVELEDYVFCGTIDGVHKY